MPHSIFLWATPRSASTAIERSFQQRGNYRIVHEPFTDNFYFGKHRKSARYGIQAKLAGLTGFEVMRDLNAAASAGPCFIKELAFQGVDFVTDEFLNGFANTFLVRHPHRVYASLLKLKPDFSEAEFGFTALRELYYRVKGAGSPIVIDGDTLRAAPENVLRTYCSDLGIAFDPCMLKWEPGPIRPWLEHEQEAQAKWHTALESSSGFLPASRDEQVSVAPAHRDVVHRAIGIYEELLSARVIGPGTNNEDAGSGR